MHVRHVWMALGGLAVIGLLAIVGSAGAANPLTGSGMVQSLPQPGPGAGQAAVGDWPAPSVSTRSGAAISGRSATAVGTPALPAYPLTAYPPSAPAAIPAGAAETGPADPTCGAAMMGGGCASDGCGAPGGGPCGDGCGSPASRFYAQGEYLLWWSRGGRLPPLVATAAPEGQFTTVFGDERVNGGDRSGFRVTMGLWLSDCQTWGIEGDYFDLGQKADRFNSELTAGNPGLGRPFIFGDTGTLVVSPVGSLDQGVAGSVDAQATNYFQSAGLRLRRNIYDGCSLRLDLLGGYRFYRMVDKVSVHEREVFLFDVGEFLQGDIRDVTDSFRAENQFHGGEIGLAANLRRGRWTLDLVSKAALGNSHEVVKIAGSTTITSPTGGSSTAETGLLVQDTNVGTHTRNEFAVIPQFSAELGYQVTCHFRAYVGYDFVYWTNVLRAGDQIDLRVDLPGTTEVSRFPEFAFHGSDFWAHGLRIGGEFRY